LSKRIASAGDYVADFLVLGISLLVLAGFSRFSVRK
jgi:hypothetical protein